MKDEMKLRRWMGLLLLGMALAGCGTSAERQPLRGASSSLAAQAEPGETSLYPVAVGSFWRYETRVQDGQEPDHAGPDQRIAITKELEGSRGSKVLLDRVFGSFQPPTTLVETTARGVSLSRYQKPEEGSITILRYSLTKGLAWPGRKWPQAAETISFAGTESVEVPAGSFVAYRLDHEIRYTTGHTDALHYWYAPGVGMVKAIETLSLQQGGVLVPHQVKALLAEFGKARGSE